MSFDQAVLRFIEQYAPAGARFSVNSDGERSTWNIALDGIAVTFDSSERAARVHGNVSFIAAAPDEVAAMLAKPRAAATFAHGLARHIACI